MSEFDPLRSFEVFGSGHCTDSPHRRAPAVGSSDLVAVHAQVLGEHFAHRRAVLDDQDAAIA
jgi:hypothetical protein